ncbi:MAG TPA: outer-membrane lipoprotein carrier protein LolA [Pyrinomonadaceae bacterium]|nr:outer-membrane lipoprotein carrier protein LolA [Pyrinomonadaceae bacterium]
MLKIDIGKPKMESFTMIKDEFTFYQQNPSLIFLDESAVAYTGKIGNSQKNTFIIFSLLQNLSKKEIKSNYDISYIGEEKTAAEIPSWHLLLSPKSKDQLKKLEIWIDNDGMIGQSKLFENNGSSTMITLNNLKKNSIIQAKEFAADIPKNTPIVKN